jgi:hypothetical protein
MTTVTNEMATQITDTSISASERLALVEREHTRVAARRAAIAARRCEGDCCPDDREESAGLAELEDRLTEAARGLRDIVTLENEARVAMM